MVIAIFATATPASAQIVEMTYSGDPFEESYNGVSNAIFAHFTDYECALKSSTEDGELRQKFLAAKKLDPATPTISASCKFSGRKCFSRQGVEVMCFDHGGIMFIDRLKLSRKATKATAELTFMLADPAGKGAGVGFSKAALEKSGAVWSLLKIEDTGAWDLRKPEDSAPAAER